LYIAVRPFGCPDVAQFEAFGLHCGGDGAKAQAVPLHGPHLGDGGLLLGILY
jgi:hypothetical protein